MKQYIRVAELSQKYKISQPTIWRWIKTGKLKSYKIGAKITVLDIQEVNEALGLNNMVGGGLDGK
jgi:excisionase family DNA binding protein